MPRAKAFGIHILVQLDFLALLIKSIALRVLGEDNSCLMSALATIWAVVVQWFVVIVRDAFFARFTTKCYIITLI